MQRYHKPPKPDGFEERMAPLRAELRKRKKAGLLPPVKIDRSPWRKYKRVLQESQRDKCGYCDSRVTATSYGDVEHYRPKSRVTTLERPRKRSACEDVEVDKHGRKVRTVSEEEGYWQLAFTWENYLFACQKCNQKYKKTLFPVEDEKHRQVPPTTIKGEKPLLLHPYEGRGPNRDPAKHLFFRPDGTVVPRGKSRWGYATIDVCCLNRSALVIERRDNVRKAWQLLKELRQAQRHEVKAVLRNFLNLGDASLPYSGALRAVFEQNCGLTWRELEALFEDEERGSGTVKQAHSDRARGS